MDEVLAVPLDRTQEGSDNSYKGGVTKTNEQDQSDHDDILSLSFHSVNSLPESIEEAFDPELTPTPYRGCVTIEAKEVTVVRKVLNLNSCNNMSNAQLFTPVEKDNDSDKVNGEKSEVLQQTKKEVVDDQSKGRMQAINSDNTAPKVIENEQLDPKQVLENMEDISNVKLLELLTKKMDSIQSDIQTILTSDKIRDARIQMLEETKVAQESKLQAAEESLEHYQKKVNDLVDVVGIQNVQIQELRSKIETMEVNNMKAHITISGLKVMNYEDTKEVVKTFPRCDANNERDCNN